MTIVTADRDKKARRFFSTREKWTTLEQDEFEFTLTKRQYDQKDVRIPKDLVKRFKRKYNDTIWVIDSIDNCFEFKLKKTGEKRYIRVADLGKVKKVYKINIIFKMQLTYIGWGLFYGIVRDEHGYEVQPIRVENLYVKNILPNRILSSVKKQLKLSYFNNLEVEESGTTSNSKTSDSHSNRRIQTNKSEPMNVATSSKKNRKRKSEDITDASKSNRRGLTSTKKKRKHNHGTQSSEKRVKDLISTAMDIEEEMFIFKKTLNTTHINASRLYVPAPFSRSMLKASVKNIWNVISPPTQHETETFKFQLLPSSGREKELKLGGDWREFCGAYAIEEGTEITMTIKSIEERTLKVDLKPPTGRN